MNEKKWSNLTQAIKDGAPIDWDEFSETNHRVTLHHPGHGKYKGVLTRDEYYHPDSPNGWDLALEDGNFDIYKDAWRGRYGWTLWVKGKLPLLKEGE